MKGDSKVEKAEVALLSLVKEIDESAG